MAEQIQVPERALVPLAPGIALEDACLIEPLGVAVHGMRLAAVSARQRVAVIGGGSIGLCAVAAAQSLGAAVSLFARHEHQSAIGERLGAVLDATGHYDIVVDCAGTRSALDHALELVKPGGRLLLLASYWEGFALNGLLLSMKEICIIPASMYSRHGSIRDIDLAAALLRRRPELPDLLISHRFPLEAAPEAFATALARDQGAIKVVLEP
jgi:threonine dehydrogenase-like Zn-dependent dehydrogenase